MELSSNFIKMLGNLRNPGISRKKNFEKIKKNEKFVFENFRECQLQVL